MINLDFVNSQFLHEYFYTFPSYVGVYTARKNSISKISCVIVQMENFLIILRKKISVRVDISGTLSPAPSWSFMVILWTLFPHLCLSDHVVHRETNCTSRGTKPCIEWHEPYRKDLGMNFWCYFIRPAPIIMLFSLCGKFYWHKIRALIYFYLQKNR